MSAFTSDFRAALRPRFATDTVVAASVQRGHKQKLTIAAATVGLAALIVASLLRPATSGPTELITVEQGSFRRDVTRNATILPLRTEQVVSGSRWTVDILSLVPEGSFVRRGDIVCVLDSAEIVDFLRVRQISLIEAEAALAKAVQDEKLRNLDQERRLDQAAYELAMAELDFEEYCEGLLPQESQRLASEILLSDDRLALADDEYARLEEMWAIGIENRASLASAAFRHTTAEYDLQQLEMQRTLLENFQVPRNQLELRSRVTESRRNLVRTELSNSLSVSKAMLVRLSCERRRNLYRQIVDDASRSLEACTIRAPRDGQIAYANNPYDRSRGIRAIEEGKTVAFEQPIFEIPDAETLKILMPWDETLITHISTRLPIIVQPAGFESEQIPARITWISPHATVRNRHTPHVREYLLEAVLEPSERQRALIRAHTDARATVVLEDESDALTVPAESITRCAGQPVVLLSQRDQLIPCPIDPGEVVDGRVIVRSGLRVGDQIVANLSEEQRARVAEIPLPGVANAD